MLEIVRHYFVDRLSDAESARVWYGLCTMVLSLHARRILRGRKYHD